MAFSHGTRAGAMQLGAQQGTNPSSRPKISTGKPPEERRPNRKNQCHAPTVPLADAEWKPRAPQCSEVPSTSLVLSQVSLFAWSSTTVMVQNVPLNCTRDKLLEVWQPDGSYDFLYLPYSIKQRRIAGYCFVNFVTCGAALDFCEKWSGRCLPGGENAKRTLGVMPADIQGLEQNLRHFQEKATIQNDKYLPAVFHGTTRMDMRSVLAKM